MTLTQIRYFIDAAKHLSIKKAAEENFVVQQVVSKQIIRLEEELGFKLFNRSCNKLDLTDSGNIMYNFWKRMLLHQEDAITNAQKASSNQMTSIKIGIINISSIYDIVSESIDATVAEISNINFIMETGSYRKLSQKLSTGELDCIISLYNENSELPGDYEQKLLLKLHPAIVYSIRHPLYKKALNFSTLKDNTFYCLSKKFSKESEYYLIKRCEAWGFKPKNIQYFDEFSSLEMALHNGNGISMIFSEFIRNPFSKLVVIPTDNYKNDSFVSAPIENHYLSLAYSKNNSDKLNIFIDKFNSLSKI